MKEQFKERIPGFLKSMFRFVVILLRYPLARYRSLPHFIIIGVQKGGTSTLFELLKQHPQIQPSVFKEVHYYDFQYNRGKQWYRSFFPLRSKDTGTLYGEASPYYFFHPLVPERLYKDNPGIKLILLLRDPVDRAYSHYQMERRKGREKMISFEEAISREKERILSDPHSVANGEKSFSHHVYSYLTRGCYDEQMQRWLQYFSKEQMLVLKSEQFFANPHESLGRIYRFLNIPEIYPARLKVKNQGSYNPPSTDTTQKLRMYFAPHNQQLSQMLNERFEWS